MDYGDDIIQLTLTNGMTVTDEFTPDNQASLSGADSDVGSGGAIVLPDQPGCKHALAGTTRKIGRPVFSEPRPYG